MLRRPLRSPHADYNQRWTRGANIATETILLLHRDRLWIEAANIAMGASTMAFLCTKGKASWKRLIDIPQVEAEEFIHSPAVARCQTLSELHFAYNLAMEKKSQGEPIL